MIFQGEDLLSWTTTTARRSAARRSAMVFQDPMTSLHPFYKVGDQIAEAILAHEDVSKKEAADRASTCSGASTSRSPRNARSSTRTSSPAGMRQRAMIAMALSLNPDLLIADEPTTALDVTVQAQILELMDRLKSEFNTAVALITHDLGVVAEHCDHIQVMYAGKIVEEGTGDDIYYHPMTPYTWGLLRSIPRLGARHGAADARSWALRPRSSSCRRVARSTPRCPYVFDECHAVEPELLPIDGSRHTAACHLSLEDRERILAEEVLAAQ